jgi:hypothetical protein
MQANYPSSLANAIASVALVDSPVIAGQTAGTDTAETYCGMVGPGSDGTGAPVGSVYLVPISAGLTASDTLYDTITVTKRTAGGATVTIASATTKTTGSGGTGSWTQYKPVPLTVVAGATLAGLDEVGVAVTHASTGTTYPSFAICVFPSVN